jgi:ubiquinone/menaquinone biosynthesis C-methylase UbiE
MASSSTVTSRCAAGYDLAADRYHACWGPIIAPASVRLLDELEQEVAELGAPVLLDIGVGTGTGALAALRRWPHATLAGVDPSSGMLAVARREAERAGVAARLTLHEAPAAHLPFPDASVDVAFSAFVLQLVPSRLAALAEARRVLRPGGRVAVVTWLAGGERFRPDDAFLDAADAVDVELPEPGRARPFSSPEAAAAALRRAGLRSVAARREWLEHRYDPDSFLAVIEGWEEDETFERLSPRRRDALRRETLRRLYRLPPDAFVWRRPLVVATGRRPT